MWKCIKWDKVLYFSCIPCSSVNTAIIHILISVLAHWCTSVGSINLSNGLPPQTIKRVLGSFQRCNFSYLSSVPYKLWEWGEKFNWACKISFPDASIALISVISAIAMCQLITCCYHLCYCSKAVHPGLSCFCFVFLCAGHTLDHKHYQRLLLFFYSLWSLCHEPRWKWSWFWKWWSNERSMHCQTNCLWKFCKILW